MLRWFRFVWAWPGRLAELERRIAGLEAGRPVIVRVGGDQATGLRLR
jgi:hypothetical protein